MIKRYSNKLREKLGQLRLFNDEVLSAFLGHQKSLSLESAGESVSSAGSTDPEVIKGDHLGWQATSPTIPVIGSET